MLKPPTALAQFQQTYSNYLRFPRHQSLPDGVPARRSRVYEELLFNNICSFINRCFPVAKKMIPSADWDEMCRHFYRDWRCHTPYFSRIPFEFVQYAQSAPVAPVLPAWIGELLDYEWRELEADLHPAHVPRVLIPTEDHYTLTLNPTVQNLQYHWPVQRIGPNFLPEEMQPTFLLVYRSFDHQVRFMEINALTSLLLQLLQENVRTLEELLAQLAATAPQINSQTLWEFGRPLLQNLLEQNVVLASQSPE